MKSDNPNDAIVQLSISDKETPHIALQLQNNHFKYPLFPTGDIMGIDLEVFDGNGTRYTVEIKRDNWIGKGNVMLEEYVGDGEKGWLLRYTGSNAPNFIVFYNDSITRVYQWDILINLWKYLKLKPEGEYWRRKCGVQGNSKGQIIIIPDKYVKDALLGEYKTEPFVI